jgi:mRNA interferase RelE/StbE
MKNPPYGILYTKEAIKNIQKLDPPIKRIIRNALESLAKNPGKGKRLAYELAGLHSLRTSDYRIIYRIRQKELIIIVVAVGHRKDIYDKLKKLLKTLGPK